MNNRSNRRFSLTDRAVKSKWHTVALYMGRNGERKLVEEMYPNEKAARAAFRRAIERGFPPIIEVAIFSSAGYQVSRRSFEVPPF